MFQCPTCQCDNLTIRHTVTSRTLVNKDEEVGDYEIGDLEWCETDPADCNDCGWEGTVEQMTIDDPENQADNAKEREEDRPCSA